MSYKLFDTFTGKVLGEYETEAQAVKAESRLMHEPGESRYEIVEPPKPKKVRSKKTNVQKEGD